MFFSKKEKLLWYYVFAQKILFLVCRLKEAYMFTLLEAIDTCWFLLIMVSLESLTVMLTLLHDGTTGSFTY